MKDSGGQGRPAFGRQGRAVPPMAPPQGLCPALPPGARRAGSAVCESAAHSKSPRFRSLCPWSLSLCGVCVCTRQSQGREQHTCCADREGAGCVQGLPTSWRRSHWPCCHARPSKATWGVPGVHQTTASSVLQTHRHSKETGKRRSVLQVCPCLPTAPVPGEGRGGVCGCAVPVLFLREGLPCSSLSADVPRNNGRTPKCSSQISKCFRQDLKGPLMLCSFRSSSCTPTVRRALAHPPCAGA